jgi:two-component system sensor histidine kinase SenX3
VQNPTPISVRAVIDEAVDRARTAAHAKNIAITSGGALDSVVYGDHNLLVTAVRNLLDNAVAYSGPATRVGVGVTERRGLVEIAVVDQGVGIDESKQDRVFERFYRVDPARSRDTGGTGLGLSIVKHVAADHGGDVTMWSEPGRGSTFTLRIPSAGRRADALTTEPGAARPAAGDARAGTDPVATNEEVGA